MAERRARIDGGNPVVTAYEVPDDLVDQEELQCRVFPDEPTVEWAVFIRNNRDREFKDIATGLYLEGSLYIYDLLLEESSV